MLLGTFDGEKLDVSPKGDPAGCVIVEDGGRSFLLADRPGNNRIDGLLNIVENPSVACLFLIPSVRETLRVNGTATIHDEPEMLDRCLINGRRPITVTRIAVDQAYLHCAKAFIRSKLWDPTSWPDQRPVPSLSEMIGDQTGTAMPSDSEEKLDKDYSATLY